MSGVSVKAPVTVPDNNAILKRAFWSGNLEFPEWKKMVTARYDVRHKRIIAESLKHLPVFWLIKEVGAERFVKKWPEWRDWLESSVRKEALDACWGAAALGDSQANVDATVARMGRKKREAIRMSALFPEKTIYKIAKDIGRDYAAVYRDIAPYRTVVGAQPGIQ